MVVNLSIVFGWPSLAMEDENIQPNNHIIITQDTIISIVTFSPDGQHIMTIDNDGVTKVRNINGDLLYAIDPKKQKELSEN